MPLSLSLIKSTLTVGQAEWKHRKAASNLTQFFQNSKVCQDLWSVLIINTKGRHYVQNQKHELLIFWETFLSLFGASCTTLSTKIATNFHRRCRHAFQDWKPVFTKPWGGINQSLLQHWAGWNKFMVNMTCSWGFFIARVWLCPNCLEAARRYSEMNGSAEVLHSGLGAHPEGASSVLMLLYSRRCFPGLKDNCVSSIS